MKTKTTGFGGHSSNTSHIRAAAAQILVEGMVTSDEGNNNDLTPALVARSSNPLLGQLYNKHVECVTRNNALSQISQKPLQLLHLQNDWRWWQGAKRQRDKTPPS